MYSKSLAETKTGLNSYGYGDTSHCNIDTHTYIHEMGHMFGLDDYYDYSYQYVPAGDFSMQDYNVGSHDPYSLMALGWVAPYIPTESCKMILKPFQESRDLILLTPSWNEYNSPFDEYLLIELYTPTGLNEFDSLYKRQYSPLGPSDVGIRLWHVDARLLYSQNGFSANRITTNPNCGYLVDHLTSNTYYSEAAKSYASPLGKDYADYNLLQLIRNGENETNYSLTSISNDSLFKEGDTFSLEKFYKQFVNSDKLNNGTNLSWSFTVTSLTNDQAVIELVKS